MKSLEALGARARELRPLVFILLNGGVMLGLSIALAVAMSFTSLPHRSDLHESDTGTFIAYGVIAAPILETFLTQALGFFLAKLCKLSDTYGFAFAWVIFALAHYASGIGAFLLAGVVGGWFLAFSFFVWQRKSWAEAFLITVACHMMNNAAAVFIIKVVDKH